MSADTYFIYPPSIQEIGHVWLTGIQESLTGKEKRSAYFTWPRLKTKIRVHLEAPTMRQWILRKLYGHTHEVFGVPFWPDKTALTSQASSGQKNLNVGNAFNRHFYEDRDCLILAADYSNYEVGTIDTIDSGGQQITLLNNLGATWPSESRVLPVFDFRLPQKNEIIQQTYKYNKITLEFTEAFEETPSFVYSLPTSGADTYLGHDIWLYGPLEGMRLGVEHPFERTQFMGLGYTYSHWQDKDSSAGAGTKDTRILMDAKVKEQGRENLFGMFDFFDSKRGMYAPFWVPTWNDDITITSAFVLSDTVLNCANLEYTTYYLPNDVIGRYVLFKFPDGSYACKKIDNATSTTITLDSQIGTTVTASELNNLKVCFLHYSRFGIDEFSIEYTEEEVGAADVAFSGLIKETP